MIMVQSGLYVTLLGTEEGCLPAKQSGKSKTFLIFCCCINIFSQICIDPPVSCKKSRYIYAIQTLNSNWNSTTMTGVACSVSWLLNKVGNPKQALQALYDLFVGVCNQTLIVQIVQIQQDRVWLMTKAGKPKQPGSRFPDPAASPSPLSSWFQVFPLFHCIYKIFISIYKYL